MTGRGGESAMDALFEAVELETSRSQKAGGAAGSAYPQWSHEQGYGAQHHAAYQARCGRLPARDFAIAATELSCAGSHLHLSKEACAFCAAP